MGVSDPLGADIAAETRGITVVVGSGGKCAPCRGRGL